MSDWENQVGEYAGRVITLTAASNGPELQQFLASLNPMEHNAVTVALAQGLLVQERANDALGDRNQILESGNIALFREKNELTAKVAELRGILNQRASDAPSGAAARVGRATA